MLGNIFSIIILSVLLLKCFTKKLLYTPERTFYKCFNVNKQQRDKSYYQLKNKTTEFDFKSKPDLLNVFGGLVVCSWPTKNYKKCQDKAHPAMKLIL